LAKQRLGVAVDEIRARVSGAVSPEEYATMTASLVKIAREFGWAEGRGLPRREGRFSHRHPGGRRGFRHGFHGERFAGFGSGEGPEPREGFGSGERFGRGEGFGRRRFARHGAPAHIHFHHHHG